MRDIFFSPLHYDDIQIIRTGFRRTEKLDAPDPERTDPDLADTPWCDPDQLPIRLDDQHEQSSMVFQVDL